MNCIKSAVVQFLKSEDGPTAVEYAFMVSLIILVCVTAIETIGTKTGGIFQEMADNLP